MSSNRCLTMVLATLLVTACSEGDGPAAPDQRSPEPEQVSLTGTWHGSAVTSFGGDRILRLVMEESGSGISGSYTIASPGDDPYWFGTITGVRDGMELQLSLPGNDESGDSPGVLDFSGVIRDAETIDGRFTSSGWADAPVVLKRQ